jgi:hypothetical protein
MKKIIALQLQEPIEKYPGCIDETVTLLMSLLIHIARGKETRV